MVRFHRHLKSALRAHLTGPNWIDELSWVLGIRTAPKEDLRTLSAELVYGAPLTVPGDFVAAPNTTASPDTLLHTLHSKVQGFMPVPIHLNMAHNHHQFPPICTAVSMSLFIVTDIVHPWNVLMKARLE